MKPSFIIAGIMKSGTTYLDNLVRSHPQVYMPRRSMEYSFFDNDQIFARGLKWYESIFKPEFPDQIIGQTSADCAFNNGTIERIKELLPDVKLIFIVRHPIHRTYSLYWHQVMMGREYYTFEEAISQEPTRVAQSYYNYKMYSYLERSRYKRQFDKIYSVFPRNQVLVIPFEQLIQNELFFLNKIFDFVNVQAISALGELKTLPISKNVAKIPTSMHVVKVSAFLQKLGMVRLGRLILNRFLVVGRPPLMAEETESRLKEFFKEDIEFHKSLFN